MPQLKSAFNEIYLLLSLNFFLNVTILSVTFNNTEIWKRRHQQEKRL